MNILMFGGSLSENEAHTKYIADFVPDNKTLLNSISRIHLTVEFSHVGPLRSCKKGMYLIIIINSDFSRTFFLHPLRLYAVTTSKDLS